MVLLQKLIMNDDAVKYHQWVAQHLHTQNSTCTISKEDLIESTSVVPAKYSPNVKLELFSQL